MKLRQTRNRKISFHRAGWATLAAIPLLTLGGCQDMKNAMQSGFAQANATATAEADRQAAYARGEDPEAIDRQSGSNADGASSSVGPSSDRGYENTARNHQTSGANGSGDPTAMNRAANDSSASYEGSEGGGFEEHATSDDTAANNAGSNNAGSPGNTGNHAAASAEPTVTNRMEDVQIGTERWGWTDAKVGWYVRYKIQGGTEMSQEVVEVTDDLLLMQTKTIMPGMDLPASRAWQARLMVKYDGDATSDCETKSNDLADETLSINGESVSCEVAEAITTCPGVTTRSTSWMSDEVPGELVKSMVDGQVAMELIEFRK